MWQLREGAHAVLADEGGAILDERTGRWTLLTATASAAVMVLLASTTEDQAAGQYATRYGIDAARATTDVHAVAHALTARGLAITEHAHHRRWWGWLR
ncbi:MULTISPECIES: PqqD family protein [Streptomyces]|uniref:PqqD family protein n=1 Tax=Streptomyces TaxID=1883 RepID=UPI0015FCEA4D|nr:PqqD family protein [Streptomyces sp. GMR22]MBA6437484.1 PqqD family protein [Streptomyces sp. GMR22]